MKVGDYLVFLGAHGHQNDKIVRLVREAIAVLHDGDVDVRVAMVEDEPDLASAHRVIATPMIIRTLPMPLVRLVGSPRDVDELIEALGHRAADYATQPEPTADAGGSS